MGIKCRKRTRKTVDFYCRSFGFREPLKVLVDGNFLHLLKETQPSRVEDALGKATNAKVAAFTTRCVSKELKEMGGEYVDALSELQKLKLHKCKHTTAVSAAKCLMEQIGKHNDDHWWVATQDEGLISNLKTRQNAPVFRMTINGIALLKPSTECLEAQGKVVSQLMKVSAWEKKTDAMRELELQKPGTYAGKKRKKAKGPNPLSCKKKKPVEPRVEQVPTSERKRRQRRRRKESDKA